MPTPSPEPFAERPDSPGPPDCTVRLSDSDRVGAFSDAVFAITITILVLEIRRPAIGDGHIGSALLHQWPEYLAFAVSFVYVGVVWLNHHALSTGVRKVEFGFHWINLGILATAALLPFHTGVLASALAVGSSADQQAAVVLYAAALVSAAWIPVFPYPHRRPELLVDPADGVVLGAQRSRPSVGVVGCAVADIAGFVLSPVIAILPFIWMIVDHAATGEGLHAYRIARLFASRPRLPDCALAGRPRPRQQ